MTYPPGPPTVPPYGGPPRSSSTATVVTALLAVAFVLATALSAWAVHSQGRPSTAAARAVPGTGATPSLPTGGYSSYPGSVATPVVPSASVTPYSPPAPAPTPTHEPLDPEAINRTFQVYMNALLNRSLSQLKSATCPRLRHTETGTALDHKYINRWKGLEYTVYHDLDYVIIPATVRYVDPNTGGNGGQHTYRWYVDRYPDGHYWVCGILG